MTSSFMNYYLTPTERENLNLIEMNNRVGSQMNSLRFSINETEAHIKKKLEILIELRKQGHKVITEAILKGRKGRIDLFDLSDSTAIEILNSEKEEACDLKDYPVRIIKIKV